MFYLSGNVAVNESWQEFKPSWDIKSFSFYSADGDYVLQLKLLGDAWGPDIPGFKNVPMSENFDTLGVRVRSTMGAININYFIKSH